MIGIDCDGVEIREGDIVEVLSGSQQGLIGPTRKCPGGFIYVRIEGDTYKMERPNNVRLVEHGPQMLVG